MGGGATPNLQLKMYPDFLPKFSEGRMPMDTVIGQRLDIFCLFTEDLLKVLLDDGERKGRIESLQFQLID